MAAQAVAQTMPTGQITDSAVEQVRLQRANLLMMLTLNIPEFEGEASTLPDFVDRGTALIDQLNAAPGDPATDKAIRQLLIGRVATTIRRQLGVTANTRWEDVVKRLKDQYGGARKPYQKQAVTLVSSIRQKGESPSQFATRMEEGARTLRAKVYETTETPDEAHKIMQVLDLLVAERLRREMPERVKKTLKTMADTAALHDVVSVIRDEDEEFGETAEREEKWVKVGPRRSREGGAGGYREKTPRYLPMRTPRREERPKKMEKGPQPQGRPKEERRCYECGVRGHIARFCPYIARRGQNVYRPEPMDINALGVERRRRQRWVRAQSGESGMTASTSDAVSSGESESDTSKVRKEVRIGRPAKRVSTYTEVEKSDTGKA